MIFLPTDRVIPLLGDDISRRKDLIVSMCSAAENALEVIVRLAEELGMKAWSGPRLIIRRWLSQ